MNAGLYFSLYNCSTLLFYIVFFRNRKMREIKKYQKINHTKYQDLSGSA